MTYCVDFIDQGHSSEFMTAGRTDTLLAVLSKVATFIKSCLLRIFKADEGVNC